MLWIKPKQGNPPLPKAFEGKKFKSYAAMADYADKHNLPYGEYWIRNDKGSNLLTSIRELKYSGTFWVEGRGNV